MPDTPRFSAGLAALYSFRRCPYAMRARLALAASGVTYELREVTLRQKPAQLLSASPKGTVPVLVLPDGVVIAQSLEIMQWALLQNDPQQWLLPRRASPEAMLALIATNDGAFKQALDCYKYPSRYLHEWHADAEAFAHVHRSAGAQWMGELESMLSDGWLFGREASLADMAVLPFVRQFAHTDAAWFAAQAWPRLRAWLAQFEASALYLGVMQKHPVWYPAIALLPPQKHRAAPLDAT